MAQPFEAGISKFLSQQPGTSEDPASALRNESGRSPAEFTPLPRPGSEPAQLDFTANYDVQGSGRAAAAGLLLAQLAMKDTNPGTKFDAKEKFTSIPDSLHDPGRSPKEQIGENARLVARLIADPPEYFKGAREADYARVTIDKYAADSFRKFGVEGAREFANQLSQDELKLLAKKGITISDIEPHPLNKVADQTTPGFTYKFSCMENGQKRVEEREGLSKEEIRKLDPNNPETVKRLTAAVKDSWIDEPSSDKYDAIRNKPYKEMSTSEKALQEKLDKCTNLRDTFNLFASSEEGAAKLKTLVSNINQALLKDGLGTGKNHDVNPLSVDSHMIGPCNLYRVTHTQPWTKRYDGTDIEPPRPTGMSVFVEGKIPADPPRSAERQGTPQSERSAPQSERSAPQSERSAPRSERTTPQSEKTASSDRKTTEAPIAEGEGKYRHEISREPKLDPKDPHLAEEIAKRVKDGWLLDHKSDYSKDLRELFRAVAVEKGPNGDVFDMEKLQNLVTKINETKMLDKVYDGTGKKVDPLSVSRFDDWDLDQGKGPPKRGTETICVTQRTRWDYVENAPIQKVYLPTPPPVKDDFVPLAPYWGQTPFGR